MNRIAVASVVAGCLAAAGTGGYLATRQNIAAGSALVAAAESPSAGPSAAQPVPAAEAPRTPVAPAASEGGPAVVSTPAPRPVPPRAAARATAAVAPRQTASRAEPTQAVVPQPTPLPAVNLPMLEPATLPSPKVADVRRWVPPPAPEPALPVFEELVVPADSVVGLQLESTISTARAQVEDRVEARIVRDIRIGGDVAIPAGCRAIGSVTVVERGGKFKERARLGIRFHTFLLPDGTRLPASTETIYRYGEEPGNRSAAKIGGGAVAGAILGAILGGSKGAAIGAGSGAGAGTAVVMTGDNSEAMFPAGTEITARILAPVTVIVER